MLAGHCWGGLCQIGCCVMGHRTAQKTFPPQKGVVLGGSAAFSGPDAGTAHTHDPPAVPPLRGLPPSRWGKRLSKISEFLARDKNLLFYESQWVYPVPEEMEVPAGSNLQICPEDGSSPRLSSKKEGAGLWTS